MYPPNFTYTVDCGTHGKVITTRFDEALKYVHTLTGARRLHYHDSARNIRWGPAGEYGDRKLQVWLSHELEIKNEPAIAIITRIPVIT